MRTRKYIHVLRVQETSTGIDQAAAEWAARHHDGSLSAVEQKELEAWLAGDIRRFGAYAKARAVLAHLYRAKGLSAPFDDFETLGATPSRADNQVSRRRMLGYGGAAAVIAGAALTGDASWIRRGLRYQTERGEVRLVPLADASLVTLNTASRVAVNFTDEQRTIHLLEGEVLFDVARDSARPFLVDAGDMLVRAIGTSFTVRRLPGQPTQVLLREGVVDILRSAALDAAPVRILANTRVRARGDSAVDTVSVAPAQISRELSWREGMLSFEDTRLDEAVAELARYSAIQISLADTTIAARTITGLFAASDAEGFARAVAAAHGLRAEMTPGRVLLHS